MIRLAATTCLLLLSLPAFADECRHSSPRNLTLDLDGVKAVTFEIGANELRVDARSGKTGDIKGRACASDAAYLDQLKLTQHKAGDTLVVKAWREGNGLGGLFGNRYAELRLAATIPDHLPVRVDVGSGDARIAGVAALEANVGSGDLEARRVGGAVSARVGSGDITLEDIGPLRVPSIGSGDVEARGVRGDVEVGGIGSGDFKLDRASGSVRIDSIGSGDAELADIAGNVSVGSIGSGDIDVHGVGGNLTVRSKGSGGIDHRDVRGTVDLPRRR